MGILEELKQGPLLFDGGMGTYFASLNDDPLARCELANLQDPALIRRIHGEYLEAGCRAVKTNTFAANTFALGLPFERVQEVLETGWRLAEGAAKPHGAYVFADIGPISGTREAGIAEEYQRIADVFLGLGARHFLFETFADDRELPGITRYIKARRPEAFILLSFAVSPDGFTAEGVPGAALLERAQQEDAVDAVGLNCMSGPYHLHRYLATLGGFTKPLAVMPNAGYPTVIGSRTFFGNNAGYFARQLAEIARDGAAMVGGCCGTTPEFIRRAAAQLSCLGKPRVEVRAAPEEGHAPARAQVNRFADKLRAGERVTAVELDPPLDTDAGFFMDGARRLKDAGIDLLTVADCPIARARMDSSLLACKVKRELGLDTMPHMTCRDRNLNAIKALLLGLAMEQVHNVLIVTGDPIPSARRDEVKSVFNFNSRMLAKFIASLGEEVASPFLICGALNVNAVNFDVQLRLAQEKVQNGVQAFLTQPVLSGTALENLQKAHETLDAKILAGVIPVVSYRNACFMNSEIPGITVADELAALYEGKDREACGALAVRTSVEIARQVAPYSDGWYFMTPFKRVDLIEQILQAIPQK
ncbi:bifunctional homocysteine S-methyltransferase/methylenetetrahydrofolate reductase [Intestinibacillus massiliensis]|nr:bifunctional homocysteine S-methyltransferase/methylenetetrahydrofolate reductase [Intestinibacillus massiliensis]